MAVVALQGAATFGSLVRITKDYRPEQIGQFGIINGYRYNSNSLQLRPYYNIAFSVGVDEYDVTEFEVFMPPSSAASDLKAHLVTHLDALLSIPDLDLNHQQALLFVVSKLHDVVTLDADGYKRELSPGAFNAALLLRFAYEDLTNGFKFGRRVSGVFLDAALEKLKGVVPVLGSVKDGYLISGKIGVVNSGLRSRSKKRRGGMMAQATIHRPSLDFYTQEKIPFTPLANDLFHHGDFGLKPRDASVLYYFLSKKPQGWVIIKEAVAKALKIGESTVSRALTSTLNL